MKQFEKIFVKYVKINLIMPTNEEIWRRATQTFAPKPRPLLVQRQNDVSPDVPAPVVVVNSPMPNSPTKVYNGSKSNNSVNVSKQKASGNSGEALLTQNYSSWSREDMYQLIKKLDSTIGTLNQNLLEDREKIKHLEDEVKELREKKGLVQEDETNCGNCILQNKRLCLVEEHLENLESLISTQEIIKDPNPKFPRKVPLHEPKLNLAYEYRRQFRSRNTNNSDKPQRPIVAEDLDLEDKVKRLEAIVNNLKESMLTLLTKTRSNVIV